MTPIAIAKKQKEKVEIVLSLTFTSEDDNNLDVLISTENRTFGLVRITNCKCKGS